MRKTIEARGTRIVLVHMFEDASAAKLLAKYGLDDVPRISDPQRTLYEAFELKRGKVSQVVGPGVWWKGFRTTVLGRHLPGVPEGDVLQLPGAFVVHDGEIVRAFRAENSADRPDFEEFAACELPPPTT